jgi:hypothetical protein
MVISCAKSLLEGTLLNLQNVDSLQWQAINMHNKLNMAPGLTQCTSTLHGTDLDERGHRTNAWNQESIATRATTLGSTRFGNPNVQNQAEGID